MSDAQLPWDAWLVLHGLQVLAVLTFGAFFWLALRHLAKMVRK